MHTGINKVKVLFREPLLKVVILEFRFTKSFIGLLGNSGIYHYGGRIVFTLPP